MALLLSCLKVRQRDRFLMILLSEIRKIFVNNPIKRSFVMFVLLGKHACNNVIVKLLSANS